MVYTSMARLRSTERSSSLSYYPLHRLIRDQLRWEQLRSDPGSDRRSPRAKRQLR